MEQKKPSGNKPKFNYYWFYAIIAVVLISLNLFNMTGTMPELTMSELTEFIKRGDVTQSSFGFVIGSGDDVWQEQEQGQGRQGPMERQQEGVIPVSSFFRGF